MGENGQPTLIDRLAEHAALTPQKTSYVFLAGDGHAQEISYRELKQRVDAVAASLADRFACGDRMMLLLPSGLDFIIAFLASAAAGLIAVPAYPPRRNRSGDRLRAMLADAAPAAVFGDYQNGAVTDLVRGPAAETPVLRLNDLEAQGSWASVPPTARRCRAAFLQYTSGSTGRPRGVIVTHANLMFNARQMQRNFGYTTHSLGVNWLPLFHDMGLVGCVLQPLYVGFTSVLLSPMSFIVEPARWLRAVTEFRATTIGGPNFAYDLCTKSVTAEQKQGLDLSSLQVVYNGSEPVRHQTIEQFTAAFGECGFRREAFFPCYGLAESTLFVSGGPAGSGPRLIWTRGDALERHQWQPVAPASPHARCLVSSGQIAEGTEVVIVDPHTGTICPKGTIGEVWIASDSVADGYWNNAADTQATFGARLSNTRAPRRYLRTGDTGLIDSGDLFIIGRIKDVIIVRGRKIYPQDVEELVEGVLGRVYANYVAVFGVETDDGEALAVVVEADRLLSRALQQSSQAGDPSGDPSASGEAVARCIGAIRETVSETFDVALHSLYFLRIGAFPRTSSGKVRRKACKELVANRSPEIVLQRHFGSAPNCPPIRNVPPHRAVIPEAI
jgi:acyl-CoA synthetase (AMP-forming)/AMP-acid ligase II